MDQNTQPDPGGTAAGPPAYLTGELLGQPGTFGRFDRALFRNPAVPAQAKVLLACIASWLTPTGDTVVFSDEKLAEESGMPERNVRRWRRWLKAHGFLDCRRQRYGANRYRIPTTHGRPYTAYRDNQASVGHPRPTANDQEWPTMSGHGRPTDTAMDGLPLERRNRTGKGGGAAGAADARRLPPGNGRPDPDGIRALARSGRNRARRDHDGAEAWVRFPPTRDGRPILRIEWDSERPETFDRLPDGITFHTAGAPAEVSAE